MQRHIAMTSRISLSLLVAALAFFVLPSYGTAQAPRRPTSPLQAATRALVEGRFEEADAMADKLDVRDPSVAAIKARSAIARGQYAQADALLRPVVTRAPASEAALELGLLQHMLGRPEAAAILERVAAQADTSRDPAELARAGRALRALGRFKEANAAYRDASTDAPGDASIQTGWGELFFEKHDNAEALKSFQMALQADPRWVPAMVGGARPLRRQPAAGRCARDPRAW
jgi:tetratricopeptide (TPR) repeat protein